MQQRRQISSRVVLKEEVDLNALLRFFRSHRERLRAYSTNVAAAVRLCEEIV